MAKEKPFHTATHGAGDAPKQKFFESSAPADEGYGVSPDGHPGAHPGMPPGGMGGQFSDAPSASQSRPPSPAASRSFAPASASGTPRGGSEWTGEFVTRMTHDLMNALGAATSFCELLIEDLPADDPRRQHADKAHQGVGLAMRLVKMLRDPARWRDQNINYLDAARADMNADPGTRRHVEKYAGHRPEVRADASPSVMPPDVTRGAAKDRGRHEVQGENGEIAAPALVPPHEALRILVVDGRSAAADHLCHGFEALGHKAFAVYDPQEAFNLFSETSGDWDVVMCPVILRGQGGAGLLQKMKTVDVRVITVLGTGGPAPQSFSPLGCDVVVESAAGAQKISSLLAQHIARTGHRPRVRVVA